MVAERSSVCQIQVDISRSQDQIPLGETIPTISMFYVYMVPTHTDVCYAVMVYPWLQRYRWRGSMNTVYKQMIGVIPEEGGY